MQGFFGRAWCAFVLLVVAGCGGGDDTTPSDPPDVNCDSGVPTYMDVSAFDVCVNCHSSSLSGPDRNGAPSSYNFDSYEGAAEHSADIVTQVSRGFMPPTGSGFSLTTEEKQALYTWAECDTPE